MNLLDRLFKRPSPAEQAIQRSAEALAAKRLVARQWLASKRMGKHWIAADRSTFEAWNKDPTCKPPPRALHLVVPISQIPVLMAA